MHIRLFAPSRSFQQLGLILLCAFFSTNLSAKKPASFPLELPAAETPELQVVFDRFKADYQRVSNDPQYMQPPASPAAWPIEISEEDQYRFFGLRMLLPEERQKLTKALRKSLRDSGGDPDTAKLPEYSNIHILPIKIQAKDGKLEGPLEIWTEYETNTTSNASSTAGETSIEIKAATQMHFRTRALYAVENGEPRVTSSCTQTTTQTGMSSSDPKVNKHLKKNQVADVTLPSFAYYNQAGFQTITFTIMDMPEVTGGMLGPNVKMKKRVMTLLMQETVKDSYVNKAYTGPYLTSVQRISNGQLEGEQIMWLDDFTKSLNMRLDQMPGYENCKIVNVGGKSFIERRTYFKNGREIKTAVPAQ